MWERFGHIDPTKVSISILALLIITGHSFPMRAVEDAGYSKIGSTGLLGCWVYGSTSRGMSELRSSKAFCITLKDLSQVS